MVDTEHAPRSLSYDETTDGLAAREVLSLSVMYRGIPYKTSTNKDATTAQLASALCELFGAEPKRSKLWFRPQPGMKTYPYSNTPLRDIIKPDTRIQLIATTEKEIKELDTAAAMSRGLRMGPDPKPARRTQVSKNRDWKTIREESQYAFHTIQPLPDLPNPERSQRFLERLADDPGIKASMRKHKFSVGMLTEMNPAEHTTQQSRTLGLNRNRGEVIELRLRTDGYDGYRDYRVIRKTLCHELSHNVWGEHDKNFWHLTKQIEEEVERGDWKHGGHRISEEEFYNPDDIPEDGEHPDSGGWSGGEFVLGSAADGQNKAGLSRREILAKAAQDRMEKERSAMEDARSSTNTSRTMGHEKEPDP